MPAAIEFYTWIAVAPRDDRRLVIHSTNFPDSIEVDLQADEPSPRSHWTDYVVGVAVLLGGGRHRPRGADPFLDGGGALRGRRGPSPALHGGARVWPLGVFRPPRHGGVAAEQ